MRTPSCLERTTVFGEMTWTWYKTVKYDIALKVTPKPLYATVSVMGGCFASMTRCNKFLFWENRQISEFQPKINSFSDVFTWQTNPQHSEISSHCSKWEVDFSVRGLTDILDEFRVTWAAKILGSMELKTKFHWGWEKSKSQPQDG